MTQATRDYMKSTWTWKRLIQESHLRFCPFHRTSMVTILPCSSVRRWLETRNFWHALLCFPETKGSVSRSIHKSTCRRKICLERARGSASISMTTSKLFCLPSKRSSRIISLLTTWEPCTITNQILPSSLNSSYSTRIRQFASFLRLRTPYM